MKFYAMKFEFRPRIQLTSGPARDLEPRDWLVTTRSHEAVERFLRSRLLRKRERQFAC